MNKTNLLQHGAYTPKMWVDFSDIVKYFYYKFEADYETIEIAYDLNIPTDVWCFLKFNGFRLENGNTLTYEEVHRIAKQYYEEVIV